MKTNWKMLEDYRLHMCEKHTFDGIRKCITTKCPLQKYGCYGYRTFREFYVMNGVGMKRTIMRIMREEMRKEGWKNEK